MSKKQKTGGRKGPEEEGLEPTVVMARGPGPEESEEHEEEEDMSREEGQEEEAAGVQQGGISCDGRQYDSMTTACLGERLHPNVMEARVETEGEWAEWKRVTSNLPS